MKDFANLTNTSVPNARAQWKDLGSRLMELPRLPRENPSPEQRDGPEEIIQDYIIVKDEVGSDASAADDADERDKEDERKARRKARTKRNAKQAAKPSILDGVGVDLDGEDNTEVTKKASEEVKRNQNIDSPIRQDRTIHAWADIGDGSKQLSDTIFTLSRRYYSHL